MNRCLQRIHSERGITLSEVLAGIALLSALGVGMTTSTVSNIQLNNKSRNIAAATALLQDKMEEIRLIVPVDNQTPADLTLGVHNDPNNPMTSLGEANGTFTRTWTVSSVSQYYNGTVVGAKPGIVQVAVTLSWTTPSPGTISAVTYACTTPNCG